MLTSSSRFLAPLQQLVCFRFTSSTLQSRFFTLSSAAMGAEKDITAWSKKEDGGQFKRQQSSFRDVISKDGKFTPDKGRYHLVVSHACPWANRVAIVRKLKGLEEILPISVVHAHMGKKGWSFEAHGEGQDGYEEQGEKTSGKLEWTHPEDTLYNVKLIRELYFKAQPDYDARFTVPIIWDTKTETIVNNESSEIIRFLNTAFDDIIEEKYRGVDFYPEELRKEIDEINEWIYGSVNNGVYKCGFATTQLAYESNYAPLHESLKRLDDLFQNKDFLVGDRLTEADIRLFTTIIRYDPVYAGHFKCGGSIRHDYPNINRWLKQLYWKNAAFKDTTDFAHIKVSTLRMLLGFSLDISRTTSRPEAKETVLDSLLQQSQPDKPN